jgi:hypothetical protein
MDSKDAIVAMCDSIKQMLLEKNAAYGDSALSQTRIFSRADAVAQIEVRIDDKLSRLKRGHDMPDESRIDTVRDLSGYLVLYLIANGGVSDPGHVHANCANGKHSGRFPSLTPPETVPGCAHRTHIMRSDNGEYHCVLCRVIEQGWP